MPLTSTRLSRTGAYFATPLAVELRPLYSDGRYHADTSTKQSILALRKDPQTAALMAGEFAKTTQGQMRASLGRDVCGGELYAAHFLGADAACKLIRTSQSAPSTSAAPVMLPFKRRNSSSARTTTLRHQVSRNRQLTE